jgi:D-serine deaminase-like pyridoxal phosphate-dependent protein
LVIVLTLAARDHPGVPALDHATLQRAFAEIAAPFALVDLDALWANARAMAARAHGKPIRVATKSVRCRGMHERVLAAELGYRGLMTFTLAETLWLHDLGARDLLLAYPTADRDSLARLARIDGAGRPIVMVDSVEQLDLIERTAHDPAAPIRVCLDLDASFPLARGRIRIGPKRSPVRDAADATALAREVLGRPRLELAGLMAYEGHIAGVGDRPPGKPLQALAIARMQRASAPELAERRAGVVAAVSALAPLTLVNGGGTGSLHTTGAEAAVTELTAGSGLYAPTLFDSYSAFELRPAAMFALPVVRRPGPRTVTLLGGGYHASGAAGADRLPQPHLPAGLRLDPREGAGEVQTPVSGAAAADLAVGDNVYMRHAKAGELCERFERLYLVSEGRIVDEVPTYRGEGKCFL